MVSLFLYGLRLVVFRGTGLGWMIFWVLLVLGVVYGFKSFLIEFKYVFVVIVDVVFDLYYVGCIKIFFVVIL